MSKHPLLFTVGLLFFLASGCKDIKNQKTTLQIHDNNRHYFPILTGQELDVVFDITNTGQHPFLLTDLMSSCGCLTKKSSSVETIAPGKTGKLVMTYNSTKNIGYVQHFITLYGNFATTDKMEIVFDVRVVPDAHYTKDYEQLFEEEKDKRGAIEDLVDGNENQKGYYMDEATGQ